MLAYQSNTLDLVFNSMENYGTLPEEEPAASSRSMGDRQLSFLQVIKAVQVARRLESRSASRRSVVSEVTGDEPSAVPDSMASLLSVKEEPTEVKPTPAQYLAQIWFGKGLISACLLAAPLALLANFADWSDTAKFWLNFVTMIPLASILGDFTEEVALHTNEVGT